MTKTPNLNLNVPDYKDQRWDVPVNENWSLLDTAIAGKQTALVSGTNIKTINNESLLGSGNIMAGAGYGISATAAEEAQKEVSIPSITALNVGQIIVVKPTITSTVANSTLKLNDFPAYPMRYNNAAITTTTDSVVWSASFPSQFIFDGDYWVFLGHGTDTNTTYTINYSFDAGKYTAGIGAYAVNRYSLIAQKEDGTWERLTDTTKNHSTGATKTVNTRGFILNQIRYYSGTSTYANGAKIATNVLYQKAASVNAAYSFNCSTTPSWSEGDYIYLVGTIGVDGLFYLDTTAWWSNALPSTNDGKLYIRLGLALTSTDATMSFFSDRPIFYHDGAKICEYKVADNKQDILVSGTNIKTVNGNSLLGSGDVDIDDLSNNITNCITKIPQDIKLELNNGTLTLKTGSKVYVPDGVDVFDTVTIENDMTINIQVNSQCLVFYRPSGLGATTLAAATSGSTAPAGTGWWYDTTNNLVKRYVDGSQEGSNGSLPLALITSDGTSVTSIDQVFNGFGYIGSVIFSLPGVKGLIPNGMNEDGSLKSISFELDSVKTMTNLGSSDFRNCVIYSDLSIGHPMGVTYDSVNNITYESEHDIYDFCIFGGAIFSSGRVTSFTPKTVLHAVDYNDLEEVYCVVESYVNGSSWYRIWSDGWIEQGGFATRSAATQTVAFLKEFVDTNYNVQISLRHTSDSTDGRPPLIRGRTTTGFTLNIYTSYEGAYWYACGYGA